MPKTPAIVRTPAAALLVLLAACAGAQTSASTGSGSRAAAWRELTSEHFVIWTNASAERARSLVRAMENLRQVVIGVSFFKKEVRGKSFVIAFNDLDEVHQYVAPQFIAHAWSGRNVLLQPVIVLAASSLDNDRRIVTHELTHVIAFNVIRNQPTWFAEGLAGYFETVRLDEEKAALDVGVPLEYRLQYLTQEGLTPIAQLFACDVDACQDQRFYATAWALVTYLLNEHPAELMQYMTRLIETPPDQQAQLWNAVFPALPPSKLGFELATWVRYGSIKVLKYKIELRDWPTRERALSEADVWAGKGVLRYMSAKKSGVPDEIKRSLSLESTNVVANMINAVAQTSIEPDVAHAITSAHPDDWRAWWLAWRAAKTAADARDAREKTCSLLEANPAAAPIDACARDATGAFAEDPRRKVFLAATVQFGPCLRKSKSADFVTTPTIDLEIAESGAVTNARVSMGSPETNACIEQLMKSVTFPAHHPGPFHMSAAH